MQLNGALPLVRDSHICCGHLGISLYTNGNPQVQHRRVGVSAMGSAFLFELTRSGRLSVVNSGIGNICNKNAGAGIGLRCIHCYNLTSTQ